MNQHDYITVVRAPACNKQIHLTDERKVVKLSGNPITNAKAKTMSVPNLAEFRKVLMKVQERDDCCIILGYVPGTEDGSPFTILSQARMRQELQLKEDKKAPDEPVEIPDRGLFVTRTRKIFHFSSIGLFDYDRVKGMPEALEFDKSHDWLQAMEEAVPGIALAGRFLVPSTSSRVLLDGEPAFDGGGWHCYMQVEEAEDLNRFGTELMVHIMSTDYGFMRPIFSQDSGDVIGHRPWGPYDPTTFSPERLVFDGAPKLHHQDFELTPFHLSTIEGGRLDTTLLAVEDAQFEAIKEQTGYQVKRGSTGLLLVTNRIDLKLETQVTTERGAMTIEEYWQNSKNLGKLRCQAVFRPDSDSWAAFLNSHDDGTPFLYDVGCQIKFTLSDEERSNYFPKESSWRSLLKNSIVKSDVLQAFEDAKPLIDEVPIMEGQLTHLIAPPGCGKTALAMAISKLMADAGLDVHYYQVDVGAADMKVYQQQAKQAGFTLHSTLECSMKDLRLELRDISMLAEGDDLKSVVFIIDTYKKFAEDVLSKRNNSQLAEVFRRITQKAGTVICLGHCNKNRDNEGMLVFSGTQDVMDDCDAMIVMDGIKSEDGRQVTVNVEFRKARSMNDQPWAFIIHRGRTLADNWVEFGVGPDPNQSQRNVKKALRDRQQEIIGAIAAVLEHDGPMSQTTLVAAVQDWCATNQGSKPGEKRIRGILHRLMGDEWTCTVDPQRSNAKIYESNPGHSDGLSGPTAASLTADDGNEALFPSKTKVGLDI